MERIYRWTSPEEAVADEVRYWREQSIEARVSGVELIRQATFGIYTDEAAPRLERAHRLVDPSDPRMTF